MTQTYTPNPNTSTPQPPNEYQPYGTLPEALPEPTPASRELISAISRAAMGEGTKPLIHQADYDVHRSATVLEQHDGYRTRSDVAEQPNHAVSHSHFSTEYTLSGTTNSQELVVQQDPRSGGFREYSTQKRNYFAEPQVRRQGPMSERRTRAAAKLVRIKFGLSKTE